MTKIVIVDIDGTLADCEHRRAFASKEKFDWYTFLREDLIKQDKVIEPVKEIVNNFYFDDYEIILVSGREDIFRTITEEWLSINRIKYSKLFMRKEKDYRPDTVIKKEIFDNELKDKDVFCVIDDRNCVVKMWRELGLLCLQVADGNF
jgi:uncharacterized HAD superfamily protein